MSPYSPLAYVVAISALACPHGIQDHRSIFAGVLDDLTQWLFHGSRQQTNADRLIFVRTFQILQRLERSDQGNTTTRHHASLGRHRGLCS
jgi:hypothetical protein